MKALFSLVIMVATMLSVSACRIEKNSVNTERKSYNVSVGAFNRITAAGAFDVHFIQGSSYKVKLKTAPELRDHIEVFTKDGTLVVRWKKKQRKGVTVLQFGDHSSDIELWVTAPDINTVAIAGSCDFTAENNLNLDRLDIAVAGSAEVSLREVVCRDNFGFQVAGSGDLEVARLKASKADMSISGSGSVEATLDHVNNTNMQISGSGDAELKFIDCYEASASISGSGSLEAKGSLRKFHRSVSGSGSIDDHQLTIRN